jgi:hypothetical protein
MKSWKNHNVTHAVIVGRTGDNVEKTRGKDPKGSTRIFAEGEYPELAHFSSSAIQEGKIQLEPKELHEYFEQHLR